MRSLHRWAATGGSKRKAKKEAIERYNSMGKEKRPARSITLASTLGTSNLFEGTARKRKGKNSLGP